ncbi:tRNA (guanine-N(7)-)-methyltransferase non-catalytic subunit trm82 [Malassezia psittaci]|uniref:tRNA (Guanine-N(7)-)-methyltransferase non-catalytic subunit trm82 n=1 Tax=Malassezia psittaci TaxID=1821823 RepID=A0AAF0JL67_9BASI|nr:tRNA (guanine-N(7)-)-methyltransferase non-catalytic subunit trm82 [Malassezia psittaci]
MNLERLPIHAVDASDRFIVVLTGANINLYERSTGKLKASLDARIDPGMPGDASIVAFPRYCALSPSENYVAIASDDKTLRVWATENLSVDKEVLRERLAKRAGTLQWTHSLQNGQQVEEVVLADKFGDVWSFPVDKSVKPDALPDTAEEDPAESSIKPRLGHVSMITSLAFLGKPVPNQIVTADRDEHIRISRWGPKRAGHVIEQFLLGSSSFVGALLPLSSEQASVVSSVAEGALVSSDGGAILRTWTRGPQSSLQLHSVITLNADKLRNYVCVNAEIERRRERVAGTIGFREAFDPNSQPLKRKHDESDETKSMDPSPLVLTHLIAVTENQILLTWEGASIIVLIPLEKLACSATLDDVYLYDTQAPILSVSYVTDANIVYVALDDRDGIGAGPALRAFTIAKMQVSPANLPEGDIQQLIRDVQDTQRPTSAPAVAKQAVLTAASHTPRAFGRFHFTNSAPHVTLSKLCLYPCLTTWPKPPSSKEQDSAYPSYFLQQRSEEVAKEMVERFQSGKRAAGRAKNQATIQQQYAES